MESTILKLKDGKKYVTRNGKIVGPLFLNKSCPTNYRFEADIEELEKLPTKGCWLASGAYVSDRSEHRYDLVTEYNNVK